MKHPAEDILIRYALDEQDALLNREELGDHLATCSECRTLVDELQQFDRIAADPDTWWLTRELLTGHARAELHEFKERLEEEDRNAAALLQPLFASSYKFAYADIARRWRYRTGGVVRLLCREANRQCEREPLFALTLAETAQLIATSLSDDHYPAGNVWRLRGNAYVEIANACRYLGSRFPQGHDALQHAARAYGHLLVHDAELARIAYVRSTLFWTQQRFDEALRCAHDASDQFAAIGDEEGFRRATLATAILQMRLNDFVAARATFQRIYGAAAGDQDDLTKARAGSSLADCLIHMGETGEALRYAVEAEQIFTRHELITEAARMRWIIGYAVLVAGNTRDAANRMRAVVAEFEALQLAGDAALAKLDLVEAYVALDRYDEARRLGSEILQYFKAHDMLTGALTAAAFLEEAARQRRLTRHQVGYVRDYLQRLPNEPQLLFLPPT